MTTWTIGMATLFAGYMLAQARSTVTAVDRLRLLTDRAWVRFLKTLEPEDYEDFCRLKDHLTKIEEHVKDCGDGAVCTDD